MFLRHVPACSLLLLCAACVAQPNLESISVRELPASATRVNLEKLPVTHGSGYEVARALARRAGAQEPWRGEERLVRALDEGREPTSGELQTFLLANGLVVEAAHGDLDALADEIERGRWVVLRLPNGLGARAGEYFLPLAVEERTMWFAGHAPDVWRADRSRVERALRDADAGAWIVSRREAETARVALGPSARR